MIDKNNIDINLCCRSPEEVIAHINFEIAPF
jgi:hypothetical protein